MAVLITDLDHAFASVFHDMATGAKAVLAWEQKNVAPDATAIEAVSTLIPVYGPEIVLMERIGFALLGAAAAALHVSGNNAKAVAAANPSLSVDLLTALAAFMQANPALVKQAEATVAKV